MEYIKPDWVLDRDVLAPTNAAVNTLSYNLLKFLNSQDPPGLPPHELHLKVGCPVILLRNLNVPTLCSGTRLVVKEMIDHIIEAQIIMGHSKNNTVFIPKFPLTQTDCPYAMQRLQFPLELSFAMTINKAHGQLLKVVGLDY
ncbi:uncharacterized protein LOC106872535 [Octopus bimaculoides]|uniref:uncharacterized protein LOC106872535 n=1 Tax=Octopus bimaculoides TaxID=37653 RepID=UPI00071C1FD8|nr:uncharacterized protein LOC106872535 [Octopus bimaculoides]|eukprot:XP_014775046.1 PREDICTED: uncharacterized protein LOC106872535 [Octopus bimaculoides]